MDELDEVKKEKSHITSEMDRVHEQYSLLNSQLENMQTLFNQFQVCGYTNKLMRRYN